jgi:hypothetical protein
MADISFLAYKTFSQKIITLLLTDFKNYHIIIIADSSYLEYATANRKK